MVRDTASYLADALAKQKKVLVEGANGALLDIDFGWCCFNSFLMFLVMKKIRSFFCEFKVQICSFCK